MKHIKKYIIQLFESLYSDKIKNPDRLYNLAFPPKRSISKEEKKRSQSSQLTNRKKRNKLDQKSWRRVIDDFSSCDIKQSGIFNGQFTPTGNNKKFDFSVSNVESEEMGSLQNITTTDAAQNNQTVDYSSFLHHKQAIIKSDINLFIGNSPPVSRDNHLRKTAVFNKGVNLDSSYSSNQYQLLQEGIYHRNILRDQVKDLKIDQYRE